MHPIIRSVGALLVKRELPIRAADLVPAHTRHGGKRLHRLVGHQGLIRAKIPVSESPGRTLPIGEDVEILARVRDTGLRKAVAGSRRAREDRVEAGNWELCLK